MKWMPIESAPKDGQFFLGVCRGESWVAYNIVSWESRRVMRGGKAGAFKRATGGVWEPTHWMPLPEPPNED